MGINTVSMGTSDSAEGDLHDEDGRRQIVLHPRTAAARRVDRTRAYGSHVRGYTAQTSEVFALVDEQRRASVRYLLVLLIPVFVMLVSFEIWPALTDWSVRGVPGPWVLLGPVFMATVVFLAWHHERRARGVEEGWAETNKSADT